MWAAWQSFLLSRKYHLYHSLLATVFELAAGPADVISQRALPGKNHLQLSLIKLTFYSCPRPNIRYNQDSHEAAAL